VKSAASGTDHRIHTTKKRSGRITPVALRYHGKRDISWSNSLDSRLVASMAASERHCCMAKITSRPMRAASLPARAACGATVLPTCASGQKLRCKASGRAPANARPKRCTVYNSTAPKKPRVPRPGTGYVKAQEVGSSAPVCISYETPDGVCAVFRQTCSPGEHSLHLAWG